MNRRVPSGAPILSASAMRALEQAQFDDGMTQAELMERAGTGVAAQAARFAIGEPILILAGPGNNGGDAYVAARHLAAAGHDVLVSALGAANDGAARAMRDRWTGSTIDFADAPRRSVIVDGLFGTGLSRSLAPTIIAKLAWLAQGARFVLAIDIVSGLATDSGDDLCVGLPATATIALGALKPAHMLCQGIERSGHILLDPIGLDADRNWSSIARPAIAARSLLSHKYDSGLVLVVGGAMPGATRLSARSALHGGAGYVLLASDTPQPGLPNAIVHRDSRDAALLDDDRIDAVLIGPGLGKDNHACDLLDRALGSDKPLVLDGDALTMLGESAAPRIAARTARTICTPHSAEFDRMFGTGGGSKIERTIAAAAAARAVIVHKGADTVIADPAGRVIVSASAPSWLASAGTGDVLAGIVASRLAAGSNDAAAEAVWLHIRAAQLAGQAFAADDMIARIPIAIGECI